MQDAIEFIQANWQEIVAGLGGIVIAARVIVLLTPTPKDDAVFAKVVGFLKKLGLVIPDAPKK